MAQDIWGKIQKDLEALHAICANLRRIERQAPGPDHIREVTEADRIVSDIATSLEMIRSGWSRLRNAYQQGLNWVAYQEQNVGPEIQRVLQRSFELKREIETVEEEWRRRAAQQQAGPRS